jgi:hypothetical protein
MSQNLELPKLPYNYEELEPWIDSSTMHVHHMVRAVPPNSRARALFRSLSPSVSQSLSSSRALSLDGWMDGWMEGGREGGRAGREE